MSILLRSERDTELLRYWLALHRLPEIGPKTFYKIIEQCDDLANFFNQPEHPVRRSLKPVTLAAFKTLNWQKIDEEIAWAAQAQHHIVMRGSVEYPLLLQQISDPPPLLYVQGQLSCLQTAQIGIVGSRSPSQSGYENTRWLTRELVAQGLSITSGLALGIDSMAHQTALDLKACTIAVVGTGLDRVYPHQHQQLAQQIVEQDGAIVSEFPLGTCAKAHHFPQRNRIISGLSMGVLVVEAALKSGSLITARYALEQGREVFALPGSIHNPLSKGCHALLRQGAKLVESSQDIIEELTALQHFIVNQKKVTPAILPLCSPVAAAKKYDTLLHALSYDCITVDDLILRTGLLPQTVTGQLLELEMQGIIEKVPGGYMMRLQHV